MECLEENVKVNAPEKATDVLVVNMGSYTEDLTLFNALVLQRAVCVQNIFSWNIIIPIEVH